MEPNESWHLDKRVPIALILTMFGQLAVVIWGAAVMYKDIESNRTNLKALDGRVMSIERNAGAQAVQLGRIEENVAGMRGDLNRMLNILERGRQ